MRKHTQILKFAQEKLVELNGYAPPTTAITLLELGADKESVDYLLFSVGTYEYNYQVSTTAYGTTTFTLQKYKSDN